MLSLISKKKIVKVMIAFFLVISLPAVAFGNGPSRGGEGGGTGKNTNRDMDGSSGWSDGGVPYWDLDTSKIDKKEKPLDTRDDKIAEELSDQANGKWSGINANGVMKAKDKVKTFVQTISALLFGFAVVMVTFAGFNYATSEGDVRKTEQAKMQIISAGIGIGLGLFNLTIVQMFVSVIQTVNN